MLNLEETQNNLEDEFFENFFLPSSCRSAVRILKIENLWFHWVVGLSEVNYWLFSKIL